jgi:hypothetical protein
MSRSTRCRQCNHTPGEWDKAERHDQACACICHPVCAIAPGYGPTPATRPGWPRANPTSQMPLVLRTYPVHPTGNDFWNHADKGTGRERNPFAGLHARGRNA